jgi:hypothetical protein
VRDLCECDPTEDVFEMESEGKLGEVVGNLVMLESEPTDVGGLFSVQVNHESSSRYFSASAPPVTSPSSAESLLPESRQGKRSQVTPGPGFSARGPDQRRSNGPRALNKMVRKKISSKFVKSSTASVPTSSTQLVSAQSVSAITIADRIYTSGTKCSVAVDMNMWITSSLFSEENMQVPTYVASPKNGASPNCSFLESRKLNKNFSMTATPPETLTPHIVKEDEILARPPLERK